MTFTGLIIGKIIASAVVEAIKHDHKTAPAQRPAAILASEANRKQLLQELNAQLPMMIDEVTRLNKTDLTADGFIYYYQFPTLTARISAQAPGKNKHKTSPKACAAMPKPAPCWMTT